MTRTIKPRTAVLTAALFASFAGVSALAQTPAPPAPPAASGTQPAPVERRPPMRGQMGGQMRPGMSQGGRQFGKPEYGKPGMHRSGGNFHRRGTMQHGGGFRGGMTGGMMGGGGFHIGPEGMWWKNPGIVQRLTLTPEQTKKMDDIFQASRIKLVDLKANVEKANAQLEPLLSANPVDTAKAMAQIDKVAQARADLEKADAKMLLGIRGVLTPDQWTKLHTHAGPAGPGGPQGAAAPRGPAQANGQGGYGGSGYGSGGGYGGGRGYRNSATGPAGVEMDDTRQ